MLDNLILGIQTAFTVQNLIWCFVGVLVGTVIGLMPGLGSTTGVAILIPLTLAFEPVTALIMLAGIYYGAQYGGTITSVLLSVPGEAPSVITALDGYQMARNGRAGAALAIAAIGSFIAAIISLALLMAFAPPFAQWALNFSPVENFAIMIFGLVIVITFGGGSFARGLMMATLGILISTVGVSVGFIDARYTFGNINLLSGIPFVEVMIGVFALGEVFHQIRQGAVSPIRARFKDLMITRSELKRSVMPIFRGTGIGFVLGTLPGAGSTLASFMAYGVERKVSKNGPKFGTGQIEGVASPESANNAAANANFIPTLALGIPGGATTAVLLGAFTIYGIQPGPLLFEKQPDLVWGLLVSFFIGNVFLLILNLPLAPVFAQMLRVPYGYLYPLILLTSFIGAYSISNNTFSVWLVFFFGILGYFFKEYNFPLAPFVLGVVLGPLFEKAMAQTSAIGQGSFLIVLERPISFWIIVFTALMVAVPPLYKKIRSKAKAK
jgi:putative tricarboxylic transport membrane protein